MAATIALLQIAAFGSGLAVGLGLASLVKSTPQVVSPVAGPRKPPHQD